MFVFEIPVSSLVVVVLTVVFRLVTLVDVAGTSASPVGHGRLDEHRNTQPGPRPTSAATPNVRAQVRAG